MNSKLAELKENELPPFDMSDKPTNCCPRFKPEGWDDRELRFRGMLFVRAKTKSLLHVPINMGSVFGKTFAAIEHAHAMESDNFIVLSRDLSNWSAEHYFAVSKFVPDQDMVRLSGDFRTRVFEGPFKNIRNWCDELANMSDSSGPDNARTFFFYTTCPKCAKYYGKNYVVGLAEIGEFSTEAG